MRIADKTRDTLILIDDQADKRLALSIVGILALFAAATLAWSGMIIALPVAALLLVALWLYAKRSAIASTLILDRPTDTVSLTVHSRTGTEHWSWPLSTIDTAEVHTTGRRDGSSGTHRPDLILTDGSRVPIRPYHSAGSQSWHAVAAIKLFLGQDLDDAPTGWLPPDTFDTLFADEMARHYPPARP